MKTNLVLVMLGFALLSTPELEAGKGKKSEHKMTCEDCKFKCGDCSKSVKCICKRDKDGKHTECAKDCEKCNHDCGKTQDKKGKEEGKKEEPKAKKAKKSSY